MSFFDDHGLVVSKESEDTAENGIYWTYQLYLLEQDSKKKKVLYNNMVNAIEKMQIAPGIYHQNPTYTWDNGPLQHRYMSHDQLQAIAGFSYKNGLRYHGEIWDQLKRQGYIRYDNHNPSDPQRWLHPRDTIYLGILEGRWLCKVLMPLLTIIFIISCLSEKRETSGKLLVWTKLKTYRMPITEFLVNFIINKKYSSWVEVFKIYFNEEGHPTPLAAKKRFL